MVLRDDLLVLLANTESHSAARTASVGNVDKFCEAIL